MLKLSHRYFSNPFSIFLNLETQAEVDKIKKKKICSLQGISKGWVAEEVLQTMVNGGNPPDFVLCIGDDRSDEDMFETILRTVSLPTAPEIFACTVGRKPSKAKYFLDDTSDVVKLLQGLAASSDPKPRHLAHFQVSFESTI